MSDLSAVIAKRESVRLNLTPQDPPAALTTPNAMAGTDQATMSPGPSKPLDDVQAEAMARAGAEGVRLGQPQGPAPTDEQAAATVAGMPRPSRETFTPPNPRGNAASPAEAVRDHVRAPLDLGAATRSAGHAVGKRVSDAAAGEGVVADIAKKLGIEPGVVTKVAGTLLEVANMPSAAAGETVKNALIQAGVDNDKAELAGNAVELGGTALFQGLTGLKGIQALGGVAGKAKTATGLMDMGAAGAMKVDGALKGADVNMVAGEIARLTQEGGGATFNMAERRNLGGVPKFAVAVAPERGVIIDGLATPDQIADFVRKNQDVLGQPGANVGTWFNEGRTYLDVSRAVDTQDEAIALGQQFRQKAVANLATFEDIPVPVPNTVGHFIYDHPTMPLRDVDGQVAMAYDALPEFDAAAVPAWEALARESHKKFDEIVASGLRVERVTGQPYQTADEMARDIERGVLKVTTDNSEHPLWDVDTNWKFRAWHDYVHHYLHGNDFSLDGEWRAYQVAANGVADPLARKALLTEVYGQAASAVANSGMFPPQKVALFDDAVEAAAKLPALSDRIPAQKSQVERALEAGSWEPRATGAAAMTDLALMAGAPVEAEDPSQAYVAAPLTTITATLLAGKKLSAIQKNALANKVAAMIWRGTAKSEGGARRALQAEFGVEVAKELDGVWEKGQAQFDKILGGLKLRAKKDVERFFRIGMDTAGEWVFPDWYGTGREIVELFGHQDAELVAKLIAATSPQTAVQDIGGKKGNVSLAVEALGMLKKGATREEIINTFDMSHSPNIWRAWQGEELQGNKVQDFWKAIYTSQLGKGDESRAVIDSHMIAALVDPDSQRISLPNQKVIHLTESKKMSDAEYAALAQFVTDFANAHGVTPRQAQQAIWIGRKLEEGVKMKGEVIEPLMDTVKRMWSEKGIADDAMDFFESRRALAFATVAIGIAAMNHGVGDSEAAVDAFAETVGLAGLINPRAAKALASVARLINRTKASVEVGPATLMNADRLRRLDSSTIKVGSKLLSIDWSTMGHSVDNLRETLQKVKEVYDVEGVHAVSRGVVKDVDEAALAKYLREELGFDADAVLARQAGEGINSSWVWASADVLRAGMRRLDELDKAVDAAAGTPGEIVALIDFAEHAELIGALAKALDGGAEEAGRTLRAFQAARDVTDAPKISFLRERHARVKAGIEPGIMPSPAADDAPGAVADVRPAPPELMPQPEQTQVPPGLARLIAQGQELPQPGAMKAGASPIQTTGDMTTGGAKQPSRPSSPLGQLRDTVKQAQSFGPEAARAESGYEAMLQQPEIMGMLMSAQRLREQIKNLPPAVKTSVVRATVHWGWDMLWEAFYDSMLKTIPGNAANLTFNAGNLSRMAAVRYMAALEPGSRYSFAHANAYAGAVVESMIESLVMAGKTFWKGESQFAHDQKMGSMIRAISGARAQQFAQEAGMTDQGVDLAEPIKNFFNAMGVVLTTGTRGMMSTDEAFRVLGFRAAMAEQAVETAFQSGARYGTPEFIAAHRAAKDAPTDEMIKIAKEHAAYITLTNSLGGATGGLGTFLRHPLVRPFVPFFSVTANLTAQNLEQLSGFNATKMLQGKVAWDIKNGGPAGAIATYKAGVGAGVLLTGWYLYHNGQLTGRMPGEPQVRKHLTDQKILPNSYIHVDSAGRRTSIPLERMDGLAGPMLLIADVLDTYYAYTDEDGAPLLSPEWLQAASASIVLGAWHNLMNRPWMQGAARFFEAISADDAKDVQKMMRTLESPAGAVATWPTGRAGAQIERFKYPMVPETHDFVDRLYAQLPWGTISYDPKTGEQRKAPWPFSSQFGERTLYPRHKANGQPYLGTPWESAMALTPWPAKGAEPDAVSNMLFNNEVRVPDVPRTFAGAAETVLERPNSGKVHGPLVEPKHRAEVERLRGNGLKLPTDDVAPLVRAFGYAGSLPDGKMGMWDLLGALEKSPQFRSLQAGPGSIQHDILQAIVSAYHKAAITVVMTKDKDLMDSFLRYQEDAAEAKLGPGGRALAEKATSQARREMERSRPQLDKAIQKMTAP